MSQAIPPTVPYNNPGEPMMPTRTSAAAVTSLICGILGCFIITGIVAIITGIIGIRATRNPQVRGRGLAIAGLVLGTLTTIGGGGCLIAGGSGVYLAYKQYAPAIQSMTGLAQAASQGDVDKTMTYVDPSRVSREQVSAVVDQLKGLGQPTKVNPTNPRINANNGLVTVDLDGTLDYPNNVRKSFTVQLTKQPDGSFKATKLSVE